MHESVRSYTEKDKERENVSYRKRHDSRMDSRTKIFGSDAVSYVGIVAKTVLTDPDVTQEVVWITLTIIEGGRQGRL